MIQATSLDEPTRWDLTNVYSSLEGDDYRADFTQLEQRLADMESLFDTQGIGRGHAPPSASEVDLAPILEDILERANAAAMLAETLDSFIHAFVSTNSYDALAAREASRLELVETRRKQLHVRLQGWLGTIAGQLPALAGRGKAIEQHQFFLTDTARQSRYLMSDELEALASELNLDGGSAFGKLQGNVTSQLKVPLVRNGQEELLPITVVRNLSFDADRQVREQAYRAEIQGWASIRTPVAACLNGVKGTAVTLCRRRGRQSVLESALDQNRIDRPTLDALLGSIQESLPMFRRYLRSKAQKLGCDRLAWWDIFAPLGASDRRFTWLEARDFIVSKFGEFSPELGEYAATAFDRRWIDGAPRDGKRGGAFCMPVVGRDESRILANFDGSFDQVSTLAHELGHGFHNHCQSGLEPLRRGTPSALAETASIFCETLITEAALAVAAPAERLMILEAQLCGATQVCLDISSRFLFETAVFERRVRSELSADELCQLMLAAQGETYGEAVDPDTYHPYMWLWKPHYYSYEHNFYNFPYAFGHLFGLGLFAVYRQDPSSFVPRYKDLLRETGQDYAAPLAARFGIDITGADFWRKSLGIVADQVQRFEAL